MYRSLAHAIRDAEVRGISLSRLALETEAGDQGRPVEEIRDWSQPLSHQLTA